MRVVANAVWKPCVTVLLVVVSRHTILCKFKKLLIFLLNCLFIWFSYPSHSAAARVHKEKSFAAEKVWNVPQVWGQWEVSEWTPWIGLWGDSELPRPVVHWLGCWRGQHLVPAWPRYGSIDAVTCYTMNSRSMLFSTKDNVGGLLENTVNLF